TADFISPSDRHQIASIADTYVANLSDESIAEVTTTFTTILDEVTKRLAMYTLPTVAAQLSSEVFESWKCLWDIISPKIPSNGPSILDGSIADRLLPALLLFLSTTPPIYSDPSLDTPILTENFADDVSNEVDDCLQQRYTRQSAFLFLR